jgi:predicted dehydrogenase
MSQIRVALIGTGGIALANHIPGTMRCRDAAVTALCDADPATLQRAADATGITRTWTDPLALIAEADIDAVIIATPNRVHYPIAMAALRAGRHVLCEKPLALTLEDAREMARAADAANVRHMTAFTYRFVPAMRYARHLIDSGAIGQPWHFRAQRFQDWDRRYLGWRQFASDAGTGELGDMLSHRLDYAHLLIGPIARVIGATRRFWDTRLDAEGREHASDLEDWVACLGEFRSGATGVFESTKLATGCGEGGSSRDRVEVNGPGGTIIYELATPHQLLVAAAGRPLERVDVPDQYLRWPGQRVEAGIAPLQAFRWAQNAEFIEAIHEERPCVPSFHDGVRVQAVMDAIVRSAGERRAVEVPYVDPC